MSISTTDSRRDPIADALRETGDFHEQRMIQARNAERVRLAALMFTADRLPHEPPDVLIDRRPAPPRPRFGVLALLFGSAR